MIWNCICLNHGNMCGNKKKKCMNQRSVLFDCIKCKLQDGSRRNIRHSKYALLYSATMTSLVNTVHELSLMLSVYQIQNVYFSVVLFIVKYHVQLCHSVNFSNIAVLTSHYISTLLSSEFLGHLLCSVFSMGTVKPSPVEEIKDTMCIDKNL